MLHFVLNRAQVSEVLYLSCVCMYTKMCVFGRVRVRVCLCVRECVHAQVWVSILDTMLRSACVIQRSEYVCEVWVRACVCACLRMYEFVHTMLAYVKEDNVLEVKGCLSSMAAFVWACEEWVCACDSWGGVPPKINFLLLLLLMCSRSRAACHPWPRVYECSKCVHVRVRGRAHIWVCVFTYHADVCQGR